MLNKTKIEAHLKAKWGRMTTALMSGDFEGALNEHADSSKEKYRATFSQFTIDQLRANLANIVDVKISSIYGKFTECGLIREEGNGIRYAHPVTFAMDGNGIWKIMNY